MSETKLYNFEPNSLSQFTPYRGNTSSANRSSSSFNLGLGLVDTAVGFLNYPLEDYYSRKKEERQEQSQIRAEERADKRTRQMYLDQPTLTAEGRRRAGLNPYGDATIPGSVAQSSGSSPTSGSAGSLRSDLLGSFLSSEKMRVDEYMGLKGLENDSIVAQAQANELNARADRLRGQESRDSDLFPVTQQRYNEELLGIKRANEYQAVVNYVADKTKEDKVSQSSYTTKEMYDALGTNAQILSNLRKDGNIKSELYENAKQQGLLLKGQVFAQEIQNTFGVREYEMYFGRDYYTGEKVGDGLAQLHYDKAYYDAEISKFTSFVKSVDWDYYDTEKTLDLILQGVEIADIVNDDVFSWMSHNDRIELERDMFEYQKRRDSKQRKDRKVDFSNSLLIKLAPYLLKAFLSK